MLVFQQSTRHLCLFLSFFVFSLHSFAAPTVQVASPRSLSTKSQLNARQGLVTVAEILGIAVDVLNGIKDIIEIITDIEDIDATEHEAESNFTQGVVLQLGESYPTWNAIVVTSDEDYNFTFNDYVYAHQECDIGLGFTKGYNIYMLDYGTFQLNGDGGFINWAFGGNYDYEDGDYVTFYPITS